MKTTWLLFGLVIIAGISGIIKPQSMVERKNQNLIKKGKPAINEEDMPKHIMKARMFSVFILICGAIALFADVMLEFYV